MTNDHLSVGRGSGFGREFPGRVPQPVTVRVSVRRHPRPSGRGVRRY